MTSIAEIQRHLGVPADGIAGAVTIAAIGKALGLPAADPKRSLLDPGKFFASIRSLTGPLDQVQVDSVNGILAEAAHHPVGWLAYEFATAWHEARLRPIAEIGKGRCKPYGLPGKYGQAPYGRGLVQNTWDPNYERADRELGLGGKLLQNFDLALKPDIAAAILVRGMAEGWFTGKKLGDYIGDRGTIAEWTGARRIVNGTDRAGLIAGYAVTFRTGIDAGRWA